jgi:FMN-dependent NADH-azoreductase
MNKQRLELLLVNSSARQQDSVTRRFANELIEALQQQHGDINIRERDVTRDMPFVDEQWVNATYTRLEQRSVEQHQLLGYSDSLVEELEQADIIVVAAPVYNFSIPASLKAWIDQICRVGRTFNYYENGPVGGLQNKQAYVVMASGGTVLGSDIDFASGYLRHVLGFIGIDDVSIISAEGLMFDNEQGLQHIRTQIEDLARVA